MGREFHGSQRAAYSFELANSYPYQVSGTVVMKFGGTSVADAERIKRAARRIVSAREQGHRVVAVLSARGKTTDELISMAEEVSTSPDPREMDMLLSTGERISCALCAMAINDLGHRAISLTGLASGDRDGHVATPRPGSSTYARTASARRSTRT